jgi:hypothetical protein
LKKMCRNYGICDTQINGWLLSSPLAVVPESGPKSRYSY